MISFAQTQMELASVRQGRRFERTSGLSKARRRVVRRRLVEDEWSEGAKTSGLKESARREDEWAEGAMKLPTSHACRCFTRSNICMAGAAQTH